MSVEVPVMAESLRDSPFAYTGPQPSQAAKSDTRRTGSSSRAPQHRGPRAPQLAAHPSGQQNSLGGHAASDASGISIYQDAREDLDCKTPSQADSSSEYQDCGSPASSMGSGGGSYGDQEEAWNAATGGPRQSGQRPSASPPPVQQDQSAWKKKLEEALQGRENAERTTADLQSQNASLSRKMKALQAQVDQHDQHKQEAKAARDRGEEAQEVLVARLVGDVIGRVAASDEVTSAWSSKVGVLQTRLERMGRMEASMAAARRNNDDTGYATQRRITSTLIAVGASSCGALAAWFIVSRWQQSKA